MTPLRRQDVTGRRPAAKYVPPSITAGSKWVLAAVRDDLRTLADLGYGGEATTVAIAFKTPPHGRLTDIQQQFNHAHNRLRAIGERGNSLLKMTFKALRNVTVCPWRIGDIVAAALVILHTEHGRTT